MTDSRLVTINGWLFNGEQVDGVEYEITDVTGVGEPAAVFASEQLVAADGASATTGYRAPRALGLQGVVRGVDAARTELGFDRVRRLFDLSEFAVTLHYLSGDRTMWVRRDAEVAAQSREVPTEIVWSTAVKAVDPAIYAGDAAGSGAIDLQTGLPAAAGGLAWPATWPVTFAGYSATGDVEIDLVSGGAVEFCLHGPLTDPQITVTNSTATWVLAWHETIPAGMWLDVDPAHRTALLQGQTTRMPYRRQWPSLAPGRNVFRFRAGAFTAGRLTVHIRPTL